MTLAACGSKQPEPPPPCPSLAEVRDHIGRIAEQTGAFAVFDRDPLPGFEQGDPEITCAGAWATINSVTLSPDPEFQGGWWFGPILMHYQDGEWVGVSAYMYPFDSGRAAPIGGTSPWPTNSDRCREAPADLRTTMGCDA